MKCPSCQNLQCEDCEITSTIFNVKVLNERGMKTFYNNALQTVINRAKLNKRGMFSNKITGDGTVLISS